jgi:hypothetical protein
VTREAENQYNAYLLFFKTIRHWHVFNISFYFKIYISRVQYLPEESYISIATLSSPKFNEEYFHLTGVHYIYNQRAENYIGVCLLFGV